MPCGLMLSFQYHTPIKSKTNTAVSHGTGRDPNYHWIEVHGTCKIISYQHVCKQWRRASKWRLTRVRMLFSTSCNGETVIVLWKLKFSLDDSCASCVHFWVSSWPSISSSMMLRFTRESEPSAMEWKSGYKVAIKWPKASRTCLKGKGKKYIYIYRRLFFSTTPAGPW